MRLEGNLETIFKSSRAAQAQNHQPLLVIQVWGKIYLLCFFTTRTYVGWACHCWWAHCSWTTSFSSLALHVVGTCWHVRKLIEKLIEKSDQNQGLDYANFTAKLNFTWCRRWQRTLGEGICFSTGRSLGRLGSCRLAEIWMIIFVREWKRVFLDFHESCLMKLTCIVTIRLSAEGNRSVKSSSRNIFNALCPITKLFFPFIHNFHLLPSKCSSIMIWKCKK